MVRVPFTNYNGVEGEPYTYKQVISYDEYPKVEVANFGDIIPGENIIVTSAINETKGSGVTTQNFFNDMFDGLVSTYYQVTLAHSSTTTYLMTVDLGTKIMIDVINLAYTFVTGPTTGLTLTLQISDNNIDFTDIGTDTEAVSTTSDGTFQIPQKEAQFVRIKVDSGDASGGPNRFRINEFACIKRRNT